MFRSRYMYWQCKPVLYCFYYILVLRRLNLKVFKSGLIKLDAFVPQLSKPEKVAIPERYVELEPEEPLSTEELAARQRKAEKIKNILTKSRSVIFWSYTEVGVKHWNLTSCNSLFPVQFNYVSRENAHRMYVLYLAYLKFLFKAKCQRF